MTATAAFASLPLMGHIWRMTDDLDLMSPEEMADPALSSARLHEGNRCRFYDRFEPNFYILSRYEDVSRVSLNPQLFLSGEGHGPAYVAPVGVTSDPPMHTFFRRLVQDDFKPGAISGLRRRLEDIADDLLDAAIRKSVWDVHDDLAFPLPVIIICEILGIPTDDIELFKRWSDASVAAMSAEDPTPFHAQIEMMASYLVDLCQRKRSDLGDDHLLARIARARREGVLLTDEEAVSLVRQIFVAGNETTTSLITNFVWRMLAHENMWADFCSGEIDLDAAINESLRYDPPLLALFRTTADDVEIGGVQVPKRSKVMMHYLAANRDPDAFVDPHRFDPRRTLKGANKILSFGLGIHFCLGAELAKLEAQVALNALRRRCPNLQLVDDGERIGPFLFWGRRHLPVRIS